MWQREESGSLPVAMGSHHVTAADLSQVRQRVVEAALSVGAPQNRVARFSVAVNEVVTNAILHGGGTATVTITKIGPRIVVEVRDSGGGIPAGVTAELPPVDEIHGRGLWLARQLSDDLMFGPVETGTLVRLSLRTESS